MWQCVRVFEVVDATFHKVLRILDMLDKRNNCQAFTQHNVHDFVGWFPIRTHEEFAQHRAEHLELKPMPPLDHVFKKVKGKEKVGGLSIATSTPDGTEHVAEIRGPDIIGLD